MKSDLLKSKVIVTICRDVQLMRERVCDGVCCVSYLSVSGSSFGVVSEHGERSFLVHQILIRPATYS